jgi:hypothetical protein
MKVEESNRYRREKMRLGGRRKEKYKLNTKIHRPFMFE